MMNMVHEINWELLREYLHNLPGHIVSKFCNTQSKEVFSYVPVELSMFQFEPVAPCSVTEYHWKDPGHILLTSVH